LYSEAPFQNTQRYSTRDALLNEKQIACLRTPHLVSIQHATKHFELCRGSCITFYHSTLLHVTAHKIPAK